MPIAFKLLLKFTSSVRSTTGKKTSKKGQKQASPATLRKANQSPSAGKSGRKFWQRTASENESSTRRRRDNREEIVYKKERMQSSIAERVLRKAEGRETWAEPTDPLAHLPRGAALRVLSHLALEDRTRLERVNKNWRDLAMDATKSETKPVWVYIIFRKNHCSGHEKMTVNISFDGPIFWNRQVAYIYCCSCHFDEHENPLMAILNKFEQRVERVCLVDKPVDYPFLPDSMFSYMARSMPKLQFIYLRELDLEKINRGTVVELANHKTLKKVIVHGCRNYEVLEDFRSLPQLLVVRGEILGLKAMLGEFDEYPTSGSTGSQQSSSSSDIATEEVTEQMKSVEVSTGR